MSKICGRCGRDLEKSGGQHSLTCPVGNTIKKITEADGTYRKVQLGFSSDEVRQDFTDMLARTALMMSSAKVFMDGMADLDDEAPDLNDQVAPLLEKFMIDLTFIYPTPQRLEVDLETLLGQTQK